MSPRKPTKQQQLNNVLKQLSRDELEAILSVLLENNRAAQDKTLLKFQHYTGSKESVITRYRALFNKLVSQYSSRGFIDYRSARDFTSELWDLLDTLDPSRIPPNDCVKACFVLFEIMEKKVVNAIDDSDGGTGDIMQKCADILRLAYPSLTEAQQQHCFTQVLYWDFESELDDYGLADYLNDLPPEWAEDKPALQTQLLSALDDAITSKESEWSNTLLHNRKLEAFRMWGRTADAENYAQGNMNIPEFRQVFINKAIQAKEYDKARSLAEEGILIAQKESHYGTTSKWRKVLLEIAELCNDPTAIRDGIIKLQRNSRFDIKLYRKFKATFSAEEWKAERHNATQQLLGKIPRPDASAEIFQEEGELRELFDLIHREEEYSFSLFTRYIDVLAPAFPEETAEHYARSIRFDLKAAGRNVYHQAVRNIEHLKSLPAGEAVANQLVTELMLEYKNRPSMLEIFRKAFDVT